MKSIYIFCFVIFSITLYSQSLDDWTWYQEDVFSQIVISVESSEEGDIWMMAGSKLIQFDGINFKSFDVLETGLEVEKPSFWNIDASMGSIIWLTTKNQVLKYEVEMDKWTVFEPLDDGMNFQLHRIKAISENEVWLSSIIGLWEYNGVDWINRKFYDPDVNMTLNSPTIIEVDKNNTKWVATSNAICFEGGCYYPGGVIKITESDTTFFDGEVIGFPAGESAFIQLDSNDDLVFVTSDFYTDEIFCTLYKNDNWAAPIKIPFDDHLRNMKLGSEDQIYLLFEEYIAFGKGDDWDVIPIDVSQIDQMYGMEVTPDDDIFIYGYVKDPVEGNKGVVGFFPNMDFKVKGKVYSDCNFNGIFDADDIGIKHNFVQTTDKDRLTFSNLNGDYSLLFSEEGTYEIEALLPKYHSFGNPVDGILSAELTTDDPASLKNDFGFEPDTSIIDLSISITALNPSNPGFQTCNSITIKNNAPRLTSGIVTLNFDDLLIYDSSSELPVSNMDNQLTFEVFDLQWLEMRNIRVCWSLPPDPELFGDTLKHFVSILPIEGEDVFFNNNVDSLCRLVTGPYDPNYIAVRPTGVGESGNISLITNLLEYTIHFQNVGNDTARNVVVHNPIDMNLDLVSLKVLGTSHDYELKYNEEDRMLIWSFEGINLPDSIVNEIGSNGFIKYTLDLGTKEVGDEFLNQADIFFDFNLPITTNTTINTLFEEIVSVDDIFEKTNCDFDVRWMDENLKIHFPTVGKYEVRLYEISGKKLLSSFVNHNELVLDMSTIANGTFIVFVQSDGCVGKGKVIVQN